jgi:hypothetical protein
MSSLKVQNLNNVQNANFGSKDHKDVVQWCADADHNFAMIAVELPVHMVHAQIKND